MTLRIRSGAPLRVNRRLLICEGRTIAVATGFGSALMALLVMSAAAPAWATSITIYGVVDAAMGYTSNGDDESQVRLQSGQMSASRIGLRGSEPIDGELKAVFNLEAGFDTDTGAGGGPRGSFAWNRQSWVGLSGRYGIVTLGRQYRPETRAVFVMDPFGGSSVASPPNTYSDLVFRTDNAIVYESPEISNWQALVMVAPGEREAGDDNARDDHGFALLYQNGPTRLAYGWDRRVNSEATGRRIWQSLGGSYDLGAATLYGAYRTRKEVQSDLDERSYWTGVSVPLGALTLRGVIGVVRDASSAQEDTTGVGLGLEYKLSKNTDVYARYAKLQNRNGADFDLGEGTAGSAPQYAAIGMRLRF